MFIKSQLIQETKKLFPNDKDLHELLDKGDNDSLRKAWVRMQDDETFAAAGRDEIILPLTRSALAIIEGREDKILKKILHTYNYVSICKQWQRGIDYDVSRLEELNQPA